MKNKNIILNKWLLIINILLLIIIIFLSFKFFLKNDNHKQSMIIHDLNSGFVFTNPILDCQSDKDINGDLGIYQKDMDRFIYSLKRKYGIKEIAFYFRDLNNGPWVGVDENIKFSPASLLKVPVLMSLLKQSEYDTSILDKKIRITSSDINENFTQDINFKSDLIKEGDEYSTIDIAYRMIQNSDNNAALALINNIGMDYIGNVFKSIGIPYINSVKEVDITVKDYAGFFRVLYNSSYLNRDTSEKALEILSSSNYNEGIVKGVPKNIKISHKFGERVLDKDNVQLHDCGIVYYPGKPYIVCIMTRGDNFNMQQIAISEISAYIYNKIILN